MDLRKLKTLIDLVSESGISELEITEGEGRVRIVKAAAPQAIPIPTMMSAPIAVAPAMAADGSVASAAMSSPASAEEPAKAPTGHVVKSPMVGTFYRSAQPGSEAFVSVGSKVRQGDTLCIIEAMKLMNEIDSEYEGEITNIYVENAQPVQYGERIFAIRLRG